MLRRPARSLPAYAALLEALGLGNLRMLTIVLPTFER